MSDPITTNEIDLKTSQVTEAVLIDGGGQLSIQPIVSNLCGAPTWTLEVSNVKDDESFVKYDVTTTGILFTKTIQSDYLVFPWKYLRLSCTSRIGDSGLVIFHINRG